MADVRNRRGLALMAAGLLALVLIVTSTQADVISQYEGLQDRIADQLDELKAVRSKAEAERDVVDERRAELQGERDAQDEVRHEVEREIEVRNDLLQEVLARKAEFDAPVLALQRQSDAVAESLRQREGSQSSSASGGRLTAPIPGAAVVSTFGPRVHPIYGDVRVHTGVDLAGGTGEPIRAAADGVVGSAGWLGGYGQAVIIEHGGPLATLYAHQSQMLVDPGQQVSRGQVIGRVGCTGSCTGPHLHYEVRIDGTPVNPASYL
ncbi:MAG: peptidoglycan DD-metalloendopeptidase family protein [Actinobacteria bacterium]|nr:peptidoglycan DD-metalloendopeptidase family protein [Actinomycetota bacterium]